VVKRICTERKHCSNNTAFIPVDSFRCLILVVQDDTSVGKTSPTK